MCIASAFGQHRMPNQKTLSLGCNKYTVRLSPKNCRSKIVRYQKQITLLLAIEILLIPDTALYEIINSLIASLLTPNVFLNEVWQVKLYA